MATSQSSDPQYAIDQIHEFASTIRNYVVFDVAEGSRSAKNRLAMEILRDVDSLTESLFASGGASAADVIEKLVELQDDASVLTSSSSSSPSSSSSSSSSSLSSEAVVAGRHYDGSCEHASNAIMNSIVLSIRDIEKTWTFQFDLWRQKRVTAESLGCDIQQLT
jgi:hypothetical protein